MNLLNLNFCMQKILINKSNVAHDDSVQVVAQVDVVDHGSVPIAAVELLSSSCGVLLSAFAVTLIK